MLVLILLTLALVGYGAYEFASHRKRARQIPVRIHVNGTRGKSSVTRLIAAGLRAGGVRAVAKVTGTLPRIIDEQGLEIPIVRLHPVNIIEQVKVFRWFERHRPEAVVVECMAVMPNYQWVCEHRFVKSTVGVITNVRMDHVIEMGPSLENIANSIANTVPINAPLYTAESRKEVLDLFRERASETGSEVHVSQSDEVNLEELRHFKYIEHPANVALALRVCEHLGVGRDVALKGMQQAHPDPGALRVFKVRENGSELLYLSALAANDPESTHVVWERAMALYPDSGRRIILLNTRGDRFNRSVQLVEMLQQKQVEFDLLVSMGESTEMLTTHFRRLKIPKERVFRLGQVKAEKAYQTLLDKAGERAFVFAMGNAGHGGLAVTDIFRRRAENGNGTTGDQIARG